MHVRSTCPHVPAGWPQWFRSSLGVRSSWLVCRVIDAVAARAVRLSFGERTMRRVPYPVPPVETLQLPVFWGRGHDVYTHHQCISLVHCLYLAITRLAGHGQQGHACRALTERDTTRDSRSFRGRELQTLPGRFQRSGSGRVARFDSLVGFTAATRGTSHPKRLQAWRSSLAATQAAQNLTVSDSRCSLPVHLSPSPA